MDQCIVAVFDNRAYAQQSMDELLASGFEPGAVRLNEGSPASAGNLASTPDRTPDDQSIGTSLKDMFSEIFGTDNSDHSRMYSEALARGNYVVTVAAADDEEVDRASLIVERFKPLDIEQQSSLWNSVGMLGQDAAGMGSGARQQAQPMSQQQSQMGSQQGASSAGGSAQGGTMQGSQQFAPSGTGATAGSSQRSGVRVYPRDLPSDLSGTRQDMGDDKYFRGHWTSNYGGHGHTYEDYAPAYRYGSSMANNDQYRGKQWNEVEGKVRTDWESKNPGSAWEKFKAAIRHGWERIAS